MLNIKNKRILICQPIVYGINGSTMVTLELAEELKKKAREVVVYSDIIDSPAREIFQEKNIALVSFDDEPKYRLEDFDLVWVHSQVLPKSLVRDMRRFSEAKKTPFFVFLHMSPLDYFSDEKPWIYGLERRLADKILVIAETTMASMRKHIEDMPIEYYRNPAPASYLNAGKPKEKLSRVLIVSNHCPSEVLGAKELLSRNGVRVDILGENGRYEPMSSELIGRYDVVITIGKTVQYCLVSTVPVYIYDHFGGCGYISSTNYDSAKSANFSGRDVKTKKTGEEIADDILKGYSKARLFMQEKKRVFEAEYLLTNRLKEIFSSIKKRTKEDFSEEYIKYVEMCQDLARHGIYYGGYDSFRQKRIVKEKNFEIKRLEQDIEEIKNSKSYKIAKTVGGIYRKIFRKKNKE